MSHLEVMVGLMDLTSHPEISGSTNTTHGHAQRGTGSLVQPTSMWCVVCVVLLGIEPSQVEHSWLASCSYGSTHLQYIRTLRPTDHVMVSMTLVDIPSTVSGVWLHALDVVLLDT